MSDRRIQLNQWLERLGYRNYRISRASADASFRCYWRLQSETQSLIVMDAPPQQESCDAFIAIATKLRDAGLSAPEILAQELEMGFLILTDFGDCSYLDELDASSEAVLYRDAMAALLVMQTQISADDLPSYDANLLDQEMDLFQHWFLGRLLEVDLNQQQMNCWSAIKKRLIENALQQPQLFVHRDYHSRNLMKLEQHNPGILDFQDAVKGPITYDLVSLLRDCYIKWPPSRVGQLALDYYAMARTNKLVDVDAAEFMQWFNLMGVQRHLKAIGIFSRLKIRDGKLGYIKDIPRTLNYLHEVTIDEACMSELSALLKELPIDERSTAMLDN